jgi:hypothetical protein
MSPVASPQNLIALMAIQTATHGAGGGIAQGRGTGEASRPTSREAGSRDAGRGPRSTPLPMPARR